VNRSIRALAFAIILLGLTAARARADLTITVGSDLTLAPGGTGTIDITLTTDHPHTLMDFGLELQITPVLQGMPPMPPSALLQFSPGADQPTPPFGASSYVFAGQSSDADGPSPFWSDPFLTNYQNDTILGGDAADPSKGPGYVPLSTTSTYLLATVQFFDPGGNTGDTFMIQLVPGGNTYFDNKNGDELNYTPTVGTVMIASAVPEPSSLTIVALSGLSGLLFCYVRGRRHGQTKNSPLATSISTH